jgi:probable selenium-dependent hydroxylase accessory protein YqeC
MDFAFLSAWHEFLPRQGGHVVAFAGGGGKTALMLAGGAQLREDAVPVVLTTTTRTEPVSGWPEVTWRDLVAGDHGDTRSVERLPRGCYLHAGTGADGKWRGLEPEQVDRLGEIAPEHVVLVEADGAAGLPVKLHRPDEPRWPARTSIAVLVMGTGALDEPAARVVHRWGRLPAGPLAGVGEAEPWAWRHFAALLLGEGGYLARVPTAVPVVLALTQLGDLQDGIGLFGFAAEVMAEPRLPLVLFGELDPARPSLRTAYRTTATDGLGGAR